MVQVESSRGAAAGKDSSDPLTDRQVDQKQADTSLHLCLLQPPPPLHPSLQRCACCMGHCAEAESMLCARGIRNPDFAIQKV